MTVLFSELVRLGKIQWFPSISNQVFKFEQNYKWFLFGVKESKNLFCFSNFQFTIRRNQIKSITNAVGVYRIIPTFIKETIVTGGSRLIRIWITWISEHFNFNGNRTRVPLVFLSACLIPKSLNSKEFYLHFFFGQSGRYLCDCVIFLTYIPRGCSNRPPAGGYCPGRSGCSRSCCTEWRRREWWSRETSAPGKPALTATSPCPRSLQW